MVGGEWRNYSLLTTHHSPFAIRYFRCRCYSRKPPEADRAEQPVAGGVAGRAGAARESGRGAAAGAEVGDRLPVRSQHAAVVIDHQAALSVEQARHHAAGIERAGKRGEREIAPAERIGLIAARRPVVTLDARRDCRRIEPVQLCQSRRRVNLFDAAVVGQLDELFLERGDVENLLIEDGETRPALRHHGGGKAGVAGAFVAEPAAFAVDDDAALLDRGPRQQAAVRGANRGIALVGADVAERGAELLTPQHGLAGAAARAEILRAADLGAEARDQVAVAGKAVDGEHGLACEDTLLLAVGIDLGADHAAVRARNQIARAVADRERNAAPLDRREQVIDQIAAAARGRRMPPGPRRADG